MAGIDLYNAETSTRPAIQFTHLSVVALKDFPAFMTAIHPPLSPSQLAAESEPLHICLLGYRSHPHVGGQGIYLYHLSRALVDLGHEVDVISGPPYPELDSRVGVIKLPSLDLYAHPNPHRALRWHHLKSYTDVFEWWSKMSGGFAEPYTFGRRLVNYFRRHGCRYHLVHDNQSLCYGLLQLQRQGIPLVATVHHPITRDRDLALAAAPSRSHRWLVRRWYSFLHMQARVVRELRHIVTVSETSRTDIAQAFGRPLEAVAVIPNGVDTRVFKPLPDVERRPWRLITTASSDQPLKGLASLLQALAELRQSWPQLHLRVIGQLKPGGETEKQLQQLNLGETVSFVSGLSQQQLVEEYAKASIAVVPSLYEGFGLPAAEAMACGLPLVCSDGGALPEVTAQGALSFRAGDVADLTRALKQLLEQPVLAEQLAKAGLARVEALFSWDGVARQWVDYYRRELLASRESAPELANAHS